MILGLLEVGQRGGQLCVAIPKLVRALGDQLLERALLRLHLGAGDRFVLRVCRPAPGHGTVVLFD
jgi:hypothetical protein